MSLDHPGVTYSAAVTIELNSSPTDLPTRLVTFDLRKCNKYNLILGYYNVILCSKFERPWISHFGVMVRTKEQTDRQTPVIGLTLGVSMAVSNDLYPPENIEQTQQFQLMQYSTVNTSMSSSFPVNKATSLIVRSVDWNVSREAT